MALVNPNIAMSFRQPDIQAPNALAQFAQIQQIQGGQQAQELARYQLGAAQRAEATQNALADAYSQSVDPATGTINYNKLTGLLAAGGGGSQIPSIEKTRRELEAAELTKRKLEQDIATGAYTQKNIQSQIDERAFTTQKKKLDFSWNAVGSAPDPQAAIAELTKGAKDGVFDMRSATAEIQKLQRMTTPEEYRAYRVEKIMGIVDAKDKLSFMLPNIARQEAGGQIIPIQNNPMMPGYGLPVQGMAPIAKTATIGDRTAQARLAFDKDKFAWEKANPGFELKEAEDGSIVGVNKRTLQAFPVSIGGALPATAPAMPGAGMPGPRVAAPAAQAISGMTSVLDQPAPAGAPAVGTPLRGKGTALTESQGNATAYGMRMKEANAVLEPLEKAGKTDTGLIKGVLGGALGIVPFIGEKLEDASGSIFNALPRVLGGLSPEQQQVMQARINFITAILRKESGAAISASEFATAEKNYFPKPGDDAAAIAQKQQARRTAIRAMEIQAGPGAKQMGGAGAIPGASANNPLGLPGL
jgi:hypothetical protein